MDNGTDRLGRMVTIGGNREKLLAPPELARWLGVSAACVRDHATRKEPRLPTVRLGRLIRFRAEEIEQWLDEMGIRKNAA